MSVEETKFTKMVKKNLEISKHLQKEPWRAEELDSDPKVLSAVMAHHADQHGHGIIQATQPSSIRDAIRGIIDAELNKRAAKAQFWLSLAGVAVSLAGFFLGAVQVWLAIYGLDYK